MGAITDSIREAYQNVQEASPADHVSAAEEKDEPAAPGDGAPASAPLVPEAGEAGSAAEIGDA